MVQIKIVGVSGSPTEGGNTDFAVKEALGAASASHGAATTFVGLAKKDIRPCLGRSCYVCSDKANLNKICPAIDDDMEALYPLVSEADALIIGSPVYMLDVTSNLKAFMDRLHPLYDNPASKNPLRGALRNKVGGAIAVAFWRNDGLESSLYSLHRFFLCHDMVVVGSGREKFGISHLGGVVVLWPDEGSVTASKDELGLKTVRVLGRRVAEVTEMIKRGSSKKDAV